LACDSPQFAIPAMKVADGLIEIVELLDISPTTVEQFVKANSEVRFKFRDFHKALFTVSFMP
jgi:cyclophilin family peptidyl-prolyl cis-trans isomerase